MITTDFKIAVRNILRNKAQSVISILGLGIGLGSILVLMALIIHETSFDKFIPEYRNVYRVIFSESCYTSYPLGEEMKKDFPEVRGYFRFNQANNIQVRNLKNEAARNQEFGFSDTSIYRILGIRLLSGVPASTITEVAISEKTALKFFGTISALGEILRVKLNTEFINLSVCGIYRNFPANSTLFPDFIADIKLTENLFGQFKTSLGAYGAPVETSLTWNLPAFCTYLVLDKNSDKQALVSKMEKYRELIENGKEKGKFSLQPVNEIYLKSDGYVQGFQFFRTGNASELKYYWSISLLILLISVTNYIFLTRAGTSDRLRELGTRKVLGASRNILRGQIILESNIITFLSLIPASVVIDSGMSLINSTLNRTLTNDVFSDPKMWLMLISVVIFTGTISGLIIGFNISRIPSLLLLSGKTSDISKTKKWNYSFLIFHFSIYMILVVCVVTVTKQIKFSLTRSEGINPKNIIISELNSPKLKSSFTAICNEMEKVPGVVKTAGSSFIPPFSTYLPLTLANPQGEKMRFDGLIMGEGMTEMLEIKVIDGSSFGPYQTARMEVLFNESSAKKYNLKVGDIYLGVFYVKGIVKDFHSHSLHRLIEPMAIIQQSPANMGLIAIKTDGLNDKAVIVRLRELFNQIDPDEIFDANYLTDQMKDFYTSEKNQSEIMGAFSILATVLAIMGLFGIAMISIARKTKEIGLRKVNGASIFEVMYLLNKDFVKWVLVSVLIGLPVSFYLMSNWQNRFAYKTELSWWIFALAGISAIMVAILTVSWQSWRAATRNPVEALRYE